MCARLSEERKSAEELRSELEREREELRTKLNDATNEVSRNETYLIKLFLNTSRNMCEVNSSRALRSVGCSLRSNSRTRRSRRTPKPRPLAGRRAPVWRKSSVRPGLDWPACRRRRRGSVRGSRGKRRP